MEIETQTTVESDNVDAGALVEKSSSAYFSMFYSGDNIELANLISNKCTEIHSSKIKAGNQLEKDVASDVAAHSSYTMYDKSNASCVELWKEKKHKLIYSKEVIDSLMKPCVISGLRFPKTLYDLHGLKCKNKTSIEVDFTIVTVDEGVTKIRLVELKNGCNFDTKKSKGEVQSLEATKKLCQLTGFTAKSPAIVCFDAKTLSDIIIKTSLEGVELMLYETMASEMGLDSGSRQRIGAILKKRALENIESFKKFINDLERLF